MKYETVYTQTSEIKMTEVHISAHDPNHTYVPLRGYGYIMAVFVRDNCVGYIASDDLGYPTVKDWMKHNEGMK